MKYLFNNWELKIVALVIALGLWQYTNGQVRVDRTIHVTVTDAAIQALPAEWQITSIEPRQFTLLVSTPANLERTFRTDVLVPRLEVSARELLKNHRQEFSIGNRMLGLDDDIRIAFESDARRTITVTFDQVEDGYLPVETPRLEHVPPGLESTVVLDRTRVKVSGPRTRLDELRQKGHRIQFLPVSLEDADPMQIGQRDEKLSLKDQEQMVRVLEDVKATITLRPKRGQPRTVTIPVSMLAGPEIWQRGRIELNPPQVTLTLRGPENLLAALKPEDDLIAYVNLRRVFGPEALSEVPVQLIAPSWLSWDPVTVQVATAEK